MSTRRSLSASPPHEAGSYETVDPGIEDDPQLENDPNIRESLGEYRAVQNEVQEAREELQDVNSIYSRSKPLQNTFEVLEDDEEKLIRENRVLCEENDELKQDVRHYRPPKMLGHMAQMDQQPVPKVKSRRAESKVRRSESKRRGEDTDREESEIRKGRERRHEEDRERLRRRFDSKRNDSGDSSRSRPRMSFVEPYGPSAPRSNAERPRRRRADSNYSQIWPKAIATATISDYESRTEFYDDGYRVEDGNYYPYPLDLSSQGHRRWRDNSPKAPLVDSKANLSMSLSSRYRSPKTLDPVGKPEIQSATALADLCLRKFVDCCSQGTLDANYRIENRQADFNLWMARMIEIRDLVGGSSSFEFGLDTRPRELSLVKNLLMNLGSYLSDCATTSEGDFLEESKQNVDSAIQNLALLATAVRQTASKVQRPKAGEDFDLSALADLRTHLECLIVVGSTASKENTRQRHEKQPLWGRDNSSDSLTPLQQRLVEANLRRRQRFLAAQQNSIENSRHPILSPIHVEQTVTPITSATDKVLPLSSKEKKMAMPPAPSISPRSESQPSLPVTSPEAPTSGMFVDNESQNAETPQTQRSFIRTATDYPRLAMPRPQIESDGHKNLHGTTMLKCPCCCRTLPHSMLEDESLWK